MWHSRELANYRAPVRNLYDSGGVYSFVDLNGILYIYRWTKSLYFQSVDFCFNGKYIKCR